MTLSAVVDTAIAGLTATVGPAVLVSDRLPTANNEIPTAVISVDGVERPHIGIGGIPSGPETGALPITNAIDLAAPRLTFSDEVLALLDPTRRVLIVPNGPIVTATGGEGPPFDAGDATITDPGGAYAITNGIPSGRQAALDPAQGIITFGQPLPTTGLLNLNYHIGVWEVSVTRFTGSLHVDVITETGDAASTVARQLGDAINGLEADNDAFQQLVPLAWGRAEPDDLIPANRLRRRLSYQFVFELRSPTLPTGGGIIGQIRVTANNDGDSELFTIPTSI